MAKKLFYKIGEACKLLDIQPYVLRYWETEFPFLSPGKSKSGQRVYSPKEIEIIRRIKVLLYEEGYTIAGAKKRLETDLPGILQSESIDDLDLDEEAFAARLRSGGGDAGAAGEAPSAVAVASEAPVNSPPAKSTATASKTAPAKGAAAKSQAAVPVVSAVAEEEVASSSKTELDTGAAMTIKTLRAGIVQALDEAKIILALLETPAGRSKASPAARR